MSDVDERLARWRAATQGLGMPVHVLRALEAEAYRELDGDAAVRPSQLPVRKRPARAWWWLAGALALLTAATAVVFRLWRAPAPVPMTHTAPAPKPLEHETRVQPMSEEALVKELARLRAESPAAADEIERVLARARAEQKQSFGHVVVGRVVTEGGARPHEVLAQMRIQQSGWFATVVLDWSKPLQFVSPDHGVIHVSMASEPAGAVAWLGDLVLPSYPQERRRHIVGKVAAEGHELPEIRGAVTSVLTLINSPTRTYEARRGTGRTIDVALSETGEFTTRWPVAPGRYQVTFDASGYVPSSIEVTVGEDGPRPVAAPKLELADPIRIQWIDGRRRVLGNTQYRATTGGAKFGFDDATAIAFAFQQRRHVLILQSFLDPTTIAHLGTGDVDDFRALPEPETWAPLNGFTPARGHVYLVRHGEDVLLFRLD